MYEEQLRRWRQTTLTEAQRGEVERLGTQLVRLRSAIEEILTIAEDVKSQTIARLLEKDDVEVAIDFLTGKLKAQEPARHAQDDQDRDHRV